MRRVIEKCTIKASIQDLIIVCGDFNVNARKVERERCTTYRNLI
jgi:hypothetical protein